MDCGSWIAASYIYKLEMSCHMCLNKNKIKDALLSIKQTNSDCFSIDTAARGLWQLPSNLAAAIYIVAASAHQGG